jgi:hypothetical protein
LVERWKNGGTIGRDRQANKIRVSHVPHFPVPAFWTRSVSDPFLST